MRHRLLTAALSLIFGFLLAAGPQVSAGYASMTVCVVDEGSAPVAGATITSPDLTGSAITDATGCAPVYFPVSSTALTATPPLASGLIAKTETVAYVGGTTHTITLKAAPSPTAVPVIPTAVPVVPTAVPVTPAPDTGSLQIVKADCDIDEVLVTQGDSTLDAPGCEPGHATFALYLYGDGTDAVVATAETHNGWTELLLAPGDYVIVEDGTWAQTTATVTDGAITWVVFHNPAADAPVPPAPAPAPAKVTTLPKTGSGDSQTSGIVLIGAAGVLLMVSGVVLTSRRRTM